MRNAKPMDERLEGYLCYSADEWERALALDTGAASEKPSIYFDLDGTLAKWHSDRKGLAYEDIFEPENHYFRDLEPNPFAVCLASGLYEAGADVCVISATDRRVMEDKWEWIRVNLPFVPEENIFFSPLGADKTLFIKGNAAISVLVDDYRKNLDEWRGCGGSALKYLNSVNTPETGLYACCNIYGHAADEALKRGDRRSWDEALNRTSRRCLDLLCGPVRGDDIERGGLYVRRNIGDPVFNTYALVTKVTKTAVAAVRYQNMGSFELGEDMWLKKDFLRLYEPADDADREAFKPAAERRAGRTCVSDEKGER